MGGAGGGLELLRAWKRERADTPFLMVTACDEVESAVAAMKLGAEDYLIKPLHPDALAIVVRRALDARRKDETLKHLQQRLESRLGLQGIVGNSKEILAVADQARRAAAADCTVLITGETGTGKELFAQAIHRNSPRKDGPMVAVNIAAVPENLVESELFGHVRGAFTGAAGDRVGRFEAADGGTLFIDEIGDLQLSSQARLLRVLENHCVTPVGSNQEQQVDVRVVAATHRDLTGMIRKGQFREDLYYRLNVVTMRLPPLAERRGDIPLLTRHFLDALADEQGKPRFHLAAELRRFLETYHWPGNVRQLRNCIESMVVMARSETLDLDDLPPTVANQRRRVGHDPTALQGKSLADLEKIAVQQALGNCGGNRTRAAEALGISVRTLQRRMRKWDHREFQDQDLARV
jgi:two-component system NtrC family response regulator/two-component system response regulator HydG